MKLSFHSLQTGISAVVETGYGLYLPKGYRHDGDRLWPFIMFLHGMGERGSDLEKVTKDGPWERIREIGDDFPFILAAPQCPADSWWNPAVLAGVLDQLLQQYSIDRTRMYLTGYSMGGAGTWALANACPEKFAAIVPVSGFFTPCDPARFGGLPIWCLHGAMDTIIPPTDSIRMVSWIREYGGNIKFDLWPDANHSGVKEFYRKAELYEWLIQHERRA